MLQIPAMMRRQIALAPSMTADQARLWELPDGQLVDLLEAEALSLAQRGATNKAIVVYQELGPLMLANAATQEFVETMGDPQLRGLLPDLPDVESLVVLVRQECLLSPGGESSLRKLLSPLKLAVS